MKAFLASLVAVVALAIVADLALQHYMQESTAQVNKSPDVRL